MFEKTTVHELFPTPVWVVDLRPDVHGPLNLKITEAVDALAAARPTIKPGETWQTDPYIHRLPQFAEVAAVIRAGAKGALDFLQIEYSAFEITGCWVNINPRNPVLKAVVAVPAAAVMLSMLILMMVIAGFTLLAVALMLASSAKPRKGVTR